MKRRSECTVYIVEDEFLVASLMQDFVEQLGFERVEHHATYAAAKTAITERTPDLCFLDVQLGGRLSFGLAGQLQAKSVPFIFTTGFGLDAIPDEWRDRPRLNKPFGLERIQSVLNDLGFSG